MSNEFVGNDFQLASRWACTFLRATFAGLQCECEPREVNDKQTGNLFLRVQLTLHEAQTLVQCERERKLVKDETHERNSRLSSLLLCVQSSPSSWLDSGR